VSGRNRGGEAGEAGAAQTGTPPRNEADGRVSRTRGLVAYLLHVRTVTHPSSLIPHPSLPILPAAPGSTLVTNRVHTYVVDYIDM